MIGSERPPEALAQYTGFLMNWVAQRSRERFAKALEAELGLHPREFGVLAVVQREPGITQQAIGDAAGVDPSTMVATLDGLEERGLAERRPHSSDRRKRAVLPHRRRARRPRRRASASASEVGKELLRRAQPPTSASSSTPCSGRSPAWTEREEPPRSS